MTHERRPDNPRPHQVGSAMRVYRWAWLFVCATLGSVGVTVVLIASPALLVSLFLGFATLGVVVTLAGAGESPVAQVGRARRVVSAGLVLGTTAPACVGLVILLSVGALLVVLVVAASSPYAVSAYAQWMRDDSTSSTAPPEVWAPGCVSSASGWAPPPVRPEIHRLSTEKLCQAWCASYLVLMERSARTATSEVLATVQERQRYLDELERRDAAGLAAWFASGARVASNPLPYFAQGRAHRATIDWDDLT